MRGGRRIDDLPAGASRSRSLRDVPTLLATPLGRAEIRLGLGYLLWPALERVASAYRRQVVARTRFVAVVGSYGKSTTTRAVSAALGDGAPDLPPANHMTGLALQVLRTRPGARHRVLEVGIDRLGRMARYERMLRPDAVVVTSIGTEHNRTFRSLERAREEKSAMLAGLGPSSLLAVNGDDENVLWMASRSRARPVTFGFGSGCDVRAEALRIDEGGVTHVGVRMDGERLDLRLQLLGRPGAYAALAALAVARAEGVELGPVRAALEALAPTPMRLQIERLDGGITLLRDEFKSGVETIDTALDVLEAFPARRRIVCIGDVHEPPGPEGPIYARLGERLARIADRIVVVSPRAARYVKGARRAGLDETRFLDAGNDAARARHLLEQELRAGDVVLVKGRPVQHLERVSLGLRGSGVGCNLQTCFARLRCEECAMLERGWPDRDFGSAYWSSVAESVPPSDPDPLWRRYSDRVNAELVRSWLPEERSRPILKTDLFDEAWTGGFLWSEGTLAAKGGAVGIDVSPVVAARARRLRPGAPAACTDVRHLPFRSGAFSAVVSPSTLDHFSSRKDIAVALAEIHRVLEPGGHALITLDNPIHPLVALRERGSALWRRLGLVPYRLGVTLRPDDLAEVLRAAGFEVVRRGAAQHFPRLGLVAFDRTAGRKGTGRGSALRFAAGFERLDRLPTRYLTGQFSVALARKPSAGPTPPPSC